MTLLIAQTAEATAGAALGTAVGIFILLVAALIAALVGALFVQLATKWVCQFTPPYAMAFKATLMVFLAAFAVEAIMSAIGMTETTMRSLVAGVIAFLVGAAIYGQMLRGPGGPIGMGKGVLVSLVAGIIRAVVVIILIFLGTLLFAAGNAVRG